MGDDAVEPPLDEPPAPLGPPRLRPSALGPKAQRTLQQILASARRLLIERGYAGTHPENITQDCGVSRATFYTYFPTKSDLLAALGAEVVQDGTQELRRLAAVDPAEPGAVTGWIVGYLAFLDKHGAFLHTWTQAMNEHPELREWGSTALTNGGRFMGAEVRRLRGHRPAPPEDATQALDGVAVIAMLERLWFMRQVIDLPVDDDAVAQSIARTLGLPDGSL